MIEMLRFLENKATELGDNRKELIQTIRSYAVYLKDKEEKK